MWDLPGGHIEGSESPHQALARELEEELGIEVDIHPSVPARTYRRHDLEFIVFMIERWQGEPRNRAPHEHDEVRWFCVDELRQLRLADPFYIELLTKVLE